MIAHDNDIFENMLSLGKIKENTIGIGYCEDVCLKEIAMTKSQSTLKDGKGQSHVEKGKFNL